MDDFVRIVSSADPPSLERMAAYLRLHGIDCEIRQSDHGEESDLAVAPADLDRAQWALEEIAFGGADTDKPGEVVDIRFDGSERTEVATWLQILLDEEDSEGTPIYFFRPEYEAMLDALHTSGQVEIPVHLIKGLWLFIPKGKWRMLMSHGLQSFFNLIESVSAPPPGNPP